MEKIADLILLLAAASVLIPFTSLVLVSLLPPGEKDLPPKSPTLGNYLELVSRGFVDFMGNTFLYISLAIAISLAVALPTAYAMTRLSMPKILWTAMLVLVIMTKSIPPSTLLVPVYEVLWRLRLTNTPIGMALAYQVYTLPFAIWILMSFMIDLPRELEIASRVDGAGSLQRFLRIVLPLSVPGIVSAAIFNFLSLWNEYLYTSVLISSNSLQTAAVFIGQMVTSEYSFEWGLLASANVLSIIPALAFLGFVQKNLSRAFAGGIRR
jgi:multiple sugar transport system permease protein